MVNPARTLAAQFVDRTPSALLAFGVALSLFDFATLYAAAAKEDVLHLSGGIGLLNNYGLFSTILGNSVFLYLAKKYYDSVCSLKSSHAIVKIAPIEGCLSDLAGMVRTQKKHRFLLYLLVIVGALFWLSNVGFHVVGNPEERWGQKVFDSLDHPLSFTASRLHNFYTWVVIMPFLGHVVIYSSIQLKRTILAGARNEALTYDLLNPDRRGGFLFVDKASIAFNIIVALVYIQVTMHVETFAKINTEHFIAYIALTLLLIGINRMFLGGIYGTVKALRRDSLNRLKDKVYRNDKISFEILKYCYQQRVNVSSIINFLINPGAILVSGIAKSWPVILKIFIGA